MLQSSQQMILMAVSGLLLSVALVVYAVYFYLLPTDRPAETTAIREATSTLAVIENQPAPDNDWRQPLVLQEAPTSTPVINPGVRASTAVERQLAADQSDELVELMQLFNIPLPITQGAPTAAPVVEIPTVVTKSPSAEVSVLPSISLVDPIACGEVFISDSQFGIFSFLGSAAGMPGIVCLGEMIGDGCTTAQTAFSGALEGVSLYTVRPQSGMSCGLAVDGGANTILVCDVVEMTNQATARDENWSGVRALFAENPGLMMSQLIQDNILKIQSGNTDDIGCVEYQLQ